MLLPYLKRSCRTKISKTVTILTLQFLRTNPIYDDSTPPPDKLKETIPRHCVWAHLDKDIMVIFNPAEKRSQTRVYLDQKGIFMQIPHFFHFYSV